MAATSVGNLRINLTAFTGKFTTSMRSAGKTVGLFAGTVKKSSTALVGMVGPLLGVAAAALAVRKAFGSAEGFTQSMQQSLAIMGDVSREMRDKMEGAARAIAKTTKFSAAEAAKAYFFLASAGLDAKQSIEALPAVAAFAQAGMFDLSTATDLLTDAQSALGLTSKDAQENLMGMKRVSDVLVKANTLANASVQQFSEALTTKAGAALKIVNKDVEEGVAVLAAFADQGVKSSEAGTALNIVLRDLQTKALLNAEAFKAAGITVFDASGKMQNMADIVRDIEMKLDGASDATKKLTLLNLGFSDKSVIFIQTLIGMSEKIRDYEKALRSSAGATDEVADTILTPWQKAWNKFKAVLEAFAIDVGAPLLELLSEMVGGLTAVLGALAPVIKGIGELVKGVGKVFSAVTGIVKDFAAGIASAGNTLTGFLGGGGGTDKQNQLFLKILTGDAKALKELLSPTQPSADGVAGGLFGLGVAFNVMGIQLMQIRKEAQLTGTALHMALFPDDPTFKLPGFGTNNQFTMAAFDPSTPRGGLFVSAAPATGGAAATLQPALAKFSREANSVIVKGRADPALRIAEQQVDLLEEIRDKIEPLDVVEL